MAGLHDDFVGPHHTKAIYDKYAGDKEIELFEGEHNGQRPDEILFKVAEFFYKTMQCDLIQQKITEDKIRR